MIAAIRQGFITKVQTGLVAQRLTFDFWRIWPRCSCEAMAFASAGPESLEALLQASGAHAHGPLKEEYERTVKQIHALLGRQAPSGAGWRGRPGTRSFWTQAFWTLAFWTQHTRPHELVECMCPITRAGMRNPASPPSCRTHKLLGPRARPHGPHPTCAGTILPPGVPAWSKPGAAVPATGAGPPLLTAAWTGTRDQLGGPLAQGQPWPAPSQQQWFAPPSAPPFIHPLQLGQTHTAAQLPSPLQTFAPPGLRTQQAPRVKHDSGTQTLEGLDADGGSGEDWRPQRDTGSAGGALVAPTPPQPAPSRAAGPPPAAPPAAAPAPPAHVHLAPPMPSAPAPAAARPASPPLPQARSGPAPTAAPTPGSSGASSPAQPPQRLPSFPAAGERRRSSEPGPGGGGCGQGCAGRAAGATGWGFGESSMHSEGSAPHTIIEG